ncbi:Moesin/ezrin/radixin 1 [Balamuthia mandrillaris]
MSDPTKTKAKKASNKHQEEADQQHKTKGDEQPQKTDKAAAKAKAKKDVAENGSTSTVNEKGEKKEEDDKEEGLEDCGSHSSKGKGAKTQKKRQIQDGEKPQKTKKTEGNGEAKSVEEASEEGSSSSSSLAPTRLEVEKFEKEERDKEERALEERLRRHSLVLEQCSMFEGIDSAEEEGLDEEQRFLSKVLRGIRLSASYNYKQRQALHPLDHTASSSSSSSSSTLDERRPVSARESKSSESFDQLRQPSTPRRKTSKGFFGSSKGTDLDEPVGVPPFKKRDYVEQNCFVLNATKGLSGTESGDYTSDSPNNAGRQSGMVTLRTRKMGPRKSRVTVVDYAPTIFADLRARCGISYDEFIDDWNYDKTNMPKLKLGAGRSGSLFLRSKHGRFILKSIPFFEVVTLQDILVDLHQHFVANKHSRIIRFLGLYQCFSYNNALRKKEETYFVVMNNLLLDERWGFTIDEKYDLKGRIPKPGKEGKHVLDPKYDKKRLRLSSSQGKEESTEEENEENGHSKRTSETEKRNARAAKIRVAVSNNYVFKDNDLMDRKFHIINNKVRDELIAQLTADVQFLKDHNCMDYSLLVGVHHLKEGEEEALLQEEKERLALEAAAADPGADGTHPSKKKGKTKAAKGKKDDEHKKHKDEKKKKKEEKRRAKEEKKEAKHKKKKSTKGKEKDHKGKADHDSEDDSEKSKAASSSPYKERIVPLIPSDPETQEVYFIGIIDPLSRYGVRKQLAHFLKRSLWTDETLSTVPANYYAERYLDYMPLIFPREEEKGIHKEHPHTHKNSRKPKNKE